MQSSIIVVSDVLLVALSMLEHITNSYFLRVQVSNLQPRRNVLQLYTCVLLFIDSTELTVGAG
jgi:hypothetical protein